MKMDARKTPGILLIWLLAGCGPWACSRGGSGPYQLTAEAPAKASPGQAVKARVRVVPGGGYKMNLEYPVRLALEGPEGISPRKREMKGAESTTFTEKELLLEPEFTVGGGEGSRMISGTLYFSVCTEHICELKEEPVSWSIAVAR